MFLFYLYNECIFFPLSKKWCKLGQHEEAKEGIVFVFSGEK